MASAENIVIERDCEPLEGSAGQITIVLRFATKAAADAWYQSPEYQAIKHPARTTARTFTGRAIRQLRSART